MKLIGFLLLFAFLAPPVAHYGHDGDVLLPDAKLTPGDTLPVTAKQVCEPGYAGKVRDVPESEKRAVDAEYGVKQGQGICARGCERDHLISLELGGSNDKKNIWTQPPDRPGVPGWQSKDRLENLLHKDVCEGHIPLATAQKRIAQDWYQTYLLSGLWKKNGPATKGTRLSTGSD